MSPRRIPYFISDSKLLLSSLVPWVALLPSNSQAEGMLVKNHNFVSTSAVGGRKRAIARS